MSVVNIFGEMWARNTKNIEAIPGSRAGGRGVYILYDGSMPVYIGKGNIRQRVGTARQSKRRGQHWDRFSWYAIRNPSATHDVEALLLRMLPWYLRVLTRQRGQFKDATKLHPVEDSPETIKRLKSFRGKE